MELQRSAESSVVDMPYVPRSRDVQRYDPESNGLPAPPPRLRQFLCNNQCPQQCCTAACPWMWFPRFSKSSLPECLQPCGGEGCACGYVPLVQTLDPARSEVQLARFKDKCLVDPPPPGYEVYAGVGEPVSDSSRAYDPRVYLLV